MKRVSVLTISLLAFFIISMFTVYSTAQKEVDKNLEIKSIRHLLADLFSPSYEIKIKADNHTKAALIKNIEGLKNIVLEPTLLNEALGFQESKRIIEILDTFMEKSGLKALKETKEASEITTALLKEAIHTLDEQRFNDLDFTLKAFAAAFEFEGVGLEKLEEINVDKDQGLIGDFIMEVLKEYHKKQATEDKRFIIATYLRDTMPDSSMEDKLLSVVKASGPYFHKLIQLVGDFVSDATNEGKKLKQVLNEVKENLLPIDPLQRDDLIKEVEAASNNRFEIKVLNTLGIASVGHAFLIDLKDKTKNTQRKVVLKFIKPGVIERAKRDADIFTVIASRFGSGMIEFYNGISKEVKEELDLSLELKNLKKGVSIYNSNDPDDRVVAVYPVVGFPESKKWLAMELAPGVSFSNFGKEQANTADKKLNQKIEYLVAGMALSDLADEWMQKAFFDERIGFYHGDLHAGNVFIDIKTEKIKDYLKKTLKKNLSAQIITRKLIEDIPKQYYTVSLIDFGNAGYLAPKERLHVLNFFLSTLDVAHSWKGFKEAYLGLVGNIASEKEKILDKELRNIFEKEKNSSKLLGAINTFFLQSDYPQFPPVMANFGRSQAMLAEIFNNIQQMARKFSIKRENYTFGIAIQDNIIDKLINGTLDVFHRVSGIFKGDKLFVNSGNLLSLARWAQTTGLPELKREAWSKVQEKFGIGKVGLKGTCKASIECANFGFGKGTVGCCANKCQKKIKDWAGFYVCPDVCRPKIGATPGTCTEKPKYNWPREIGEPCKGAYDCKDGSAYLVSSGVGCCKDICTKKVKKLVGYVCPK